MAWSHRWYVTHRKLQDGRTKKWYKNNFEAGRRIKRISKLKILYGLTEEEYQFLWDSQNGKCAISGHPLGKKTAHTDHDHKTGKVRGLIHQKINMALGLFGDDPVLLRAAANYLEGANANSN